MIFDIVFSGCEVDYVLVVYRVIATGLFQLPNSSSWIDQQAPHLEYE